MTLLRLGVSACLVGRAVRWNGGHKRDRTLTDELGPWVEWVEVCPEAEVLGTPRPTVRLTQDGDALRLVESAAGTDHTDAVDQYGAHWLDEQGAGPGGSDTEPPFHGFVLKKGSPTCGPSDVRVWADEIPGRHGVGLFAARLAARWPHLPIIDEGRLRAPSLREAFLERAVALRRWHDHLAGPAGAVDLQRFHARHKLQLMAHHPDAARQSGRIVADGGGSAEYGTAFHDALATPATRGRHVNVLQHALGYVSDALDATERKEAVATVASYAAGNVPLVVPLALLRFLAATRDAPEWLREQTYLDPYPAEWRLRNHD